MENEELIIRAQQGQIQQPKCPRCHSLLEFLCNVARTPPGHLVDVIWCGRCGHTLQTQFIGMDEPRIQPPGIGLVRPA